MLDKSKIPKKYDFTKNRWPSLIYENIEDEGLLSKVKEIDEDTKNLNNKFDEYCKFIRKIEPLRKEENIIYEEYCEFVKKNFQRTSRQEKYKEFIFFDKVQTVHDNYFENNEIEKLFFKKAKNLISNFNEIYKLYRSFFNVNEMADYKYFFPKDTANSKCGPFYPTHVDFPFNVEYMRDIDTFTDHRRKDYMSDSSFDSKPCTNRTYGFYTRLHALGVEEILDIHGNMTQFYKVRVPYLPTENYARWYFDKIIDENNKLGRRIELILRSRKRSVELAENFNYVYVFSNKSYPKNTYKIGWTSGLPEDRADQLSSETGVLHPFKVEYSKKFKDAENVEKKIHQHFNEYRVRKNKEYFDLDIKKIKIYIEGIEGAKIRTKKYESELDNKLLEDEEW